MAFRSKSKSRAGRSTSRRSSSSGYSRGRASTKQRTRTSSRANRTSTVRIVVEQVAAQAVNPFAQGIPQTITPSKKATF